MTTNKITMNINGFDMPFLETDPSQPYRYERRMGLTGLQYREPDMNDPYERFLAKLIKHSVDESYEDWADSW